jgi:hypothetical protein
MFGMTGHPQITPLNVEEDVIVNPTFEAEAYPEGGFRAYTVLFGTWCSLLAASGILNTTGALQPYLLRHQLKDRSESEVGWVFSVFGFLFFLGGIFGGVYDRRIPE